MHLPSRRRSISHLVAVAAVATTSVVLLAPAPVAAVDVLVDDFRISNMGTGAIPTAEAQQAKVAYSTVADRYLVVWRGDDDAIGKANIYGQLIDGDDGAVFGTEFLVGQIGDAADPDTDAIEPAVAYHGGRNEFVVTFTGDVDSTDVSPIVSETFDIYAQRVSVTGTLIGAPLQVSDMGNDPANASFDANFSDVAVNPSGDQLLVVWQGDDDSLGNNATEVFGQLLGYSAGNIVEIGTNDFRISTTGPEGNTTTDARAPSVAFNSLAGAYYVAWEANDNEAAVAEFEVRGTPVSAAGVVANTDGDVLSAGASDEAFQPDIVVNPSTGAHLVVFMADDGANEFEVYRRVVDSVGTPQGTADAISAAGPAGTASIAQTPAITYDALQSQFVVVWAGDDPVLGTVDNEYEVFLRRLNSAGAAVGSAHRVTTMGPDGQINATTALPDVAFGGAAAGAALVVWSAENPPVTVANEAEIWGQFDAPATDLAVTVTPLSDTSPAPGAPVQFRIDWSNGADVTVPSVQVTAQLDPAAVNVSSTHPSASVVGNTVTVNLGTLAPNASGSIVVDAVVNASAANGEVLAIDAEIDTGSLIAESDPGDNVATAQVVVDRPPTVVLSLAPGQDDPTNNQPTVFRATFSEPVSGFEALDVDFTATTVGLPVVSIAAVDPATYNIEVLGHTGVGTLEVDLGADAVTDLDGDPEGNLAAPAPVSVVYDDVRPTVEIAAAVGQLDPTGVQPVKFDVVFSEPVTDVSLGDFSLAAPAPTGAAVSAVNGSGAAWVVEVSGATASGDVTLRLDADAAFDAAGNGNEAPTPGDHTVTLDISPPTPTIDRAVGQPDLTGASPVRFSVTFDEPVTNFDGTDPLLVTLGLVGGSAEVTGAGAVYEVAIAGFSGEGSIRLVIPAGAAVDVLGNPSLAANVVDNTVLIDTVAPTVTVDRAAGQLDPTNAGPIEFDIVFSKPVTDFTADDVVLGGTAVPATKVLGGSGQNWTLSVDGMAGFGTVTATVAAGSVIDAAGNVNPVSTGDNVVTYVPGDPTPGVNDPPTIAAPPTLAAELGVAVDLTGANLVTVFDPDAFAADISVTLTAAHSTIVVPPTAGVTITGSGSGNVTLVGPYPAVNAALLASTVSFSETGAISLDVTVDDLGHSPPPALTSAATIAVTVDDTTPPVITIPSATVRVNTDPGRPGAVVTYVATATDRGSTPPGGVPTAFATRLIEAAPPTLTCTPASGSFFPIGVTTVTCTAVDGAGNTATATFAVEVTDVERPVIGSVPAIRLELAPRVPSGAITYAVPTVSDNSGSASVTCIPPSGTVLVPGISTGTCTATDPSGNTASTTFQIVVVAGQLPPTGGGSGPVPLAGVLLAVGCALALISRRRRLTSRAA